MAVKKLLSSAPSVYTLNVGGKLFQVSKSIFDKIPQAALEHAAVVSTRTSLVGPEWFFDRDPSLFGYILTFFRTGELHMLRNVCGTTMKSELEFWGIPESSIGPCCWRTYVDMTAEVEQRQRVEKELQGDDGMAYTSEPSSAVEEVKQRIWRILYYSTSTRLAKV